MLKKANTHFLRPTQVMEYKTNKEWTWEWKQKRQKVQRVNAITTLNAIYF